MKRNILLIAACIVVFVCLYLGLFYTNRSTIDNLTKGNTIEYKVIELDGCEYIMYHSVYNTMDDRLEHKGNCRYCQERLKETLKSLK
jgi:hypothetical protein